MEALSTVTAQAQSLPVGNSNNVIERGTVDNVERGEAIRRRRMALGIRSVRELAMRTGIHRGAVSGAEHGKASVGTYERLEAYLSSQEAGEEGVPIVRPIGDPGEGVMEVIVEGNFGVRTIVRGPVSDPDALADMAERLIRSMSTPREGEPPED